MAVAHKYLMVGGYATNTLAQAQAHVFLVAGKFMLLRTMIEMVTKCGMENCF